MDRKALLGAGHTLEESEVYGLVREAATLTTKTCTKELVQFSCSHTSQHQVLIYLVLFRSAGSV